MQERPGGSEICTLWLIEDDEPYSNTLKRLVDNSGRMECTHVFRRCEDALAVWSEEGPPDIVLVDIGLPGGMNGIEGAAQFKSRSPRTEIIMVTVFQDDDKVFKSICAGASGYLTKSAPASEIVEQIQVVLGGGSPINARIARKVLDMIAESNAPKNDYNLTARESEILHLLVEGLSIQKIADRLFVSYSTASTHIRHIYEKLQVHTRASAVYKAVTERL
jgi:DNA-binding NarL/FixJ family response regulator